MATEPIEEMLMTLLSPIDGQAGAMATCTSAASTTQQKALTISDIERAVKLLRNIPPEPIGEWMRAKGCPPERWRMVLPARLREEAGGPMFWPSYVAFSTAIDAPVFIPRA